MIWVIAFLTFACFAALAVIYSLLFNTEDAPDWVEMDEYYRSRWYK